MQRCHVLLQVHRDAAQRIDGIVNAVQVGHEHDHVAGRQPPVQNHPTAVSQHQRLAEVAQRALQEQVAVAQPRTFEIIAVSFLGSCLQAVSLAGFGTRQLHGLDGGERVVDAHRDVLPHHVILGHAGFQAARRMPRDDEINRQDGQRRHREPPALRQHDGADADDADRFRGNLPRHRRNHRRHLVGLIDAPRQAPAGAPAEEGERQPHYVAEGGLDQVRLDGARHRRALHVGGQGEEVAEHADGKE